LHLRGKDSARMAIHANDNSDWRAFEESEPTHSAAHYLTTIMHLRKKNGYARVTDVAEHMRVSRGAASRAVSLFKERGWIREDEHRMLNLTEDGMELARGVERNFMILERFFTDILGLTEEVAHQDACKIEHLLDSETTRAMFRLVRVFHDAPAMAEAARERLAKLDASCDRRDCRICENYDDCLAQDALARQRRLGADPATGGP
jgi:Mn-dependent DtxR family transcriptional regulator